ncbi:MAG: hypothetical protein AAF709_17480 [Pseudomonadota bacterium]
MTRDADNDNSAAAARLRPDQAQSWQGMSHGNAALADRLAADMNTYAASEFQSSADGDGAIAVAAADTLRGSATAEPVNNDFESNNATAGWTVATSIPSSDALPIEVLGLATPHRPIPAARQMQLEPRPLSRPRTRRQPHEADLGKQGNAHLFNIPPEAAQPEQSPMEQAINVKPRSSLTSQPGFLAGLVAALVIGGGYYAYLVF